MWFRGARYRLVADMARGNISDSFEISLSAAKAYRRGAQEPPRRKPGEKMIKVVRLDGKWKVQGGPAKLAPRDDRDALSMMWFGRNQLSVSAP